MWPACSNFCVFSLLAVLWTVPRFGRVQIQYTDMHSIDRSIHPSAGAAASNKLYVLHHVTRVMAIENHNEKMQMRSFTTTKKRWRAKPRCCGCCCCCCSDGVVPIGAESCIFFFSFSWRVAKFQRGDELLCEAGGYKSGIETNLKNQAARTERKERSKEANVRNKSSDSGNPRIREAVNAPVEQRVTSMLIRQECLPFPLPGSGRREKQTGPLRWKFFSWQCCCFFLWRDSPSFPTEPHAPPGIHTDTRTSLPKTAANSAVLCTLTRTGSGRWSNSLRRLFLEKNRAQPAENPIFPPRTRTRTQGRYEHEKFCALLLRFFGVDVLRVTFSFLGCLPRVHVGSALGFWPLFIAAKLHELPRFRRVLPHSPMVVTSCCIQLRPPNCSGEVERKRKREKKGEDPLRFLVSNVTRPSPPNNRFSPLAAGFLKRVPNPDIHSLTHTRGLEQTYSFERRRILLSPACELANWKDDRTHTHTHNTPTGNEQNQKRTEQRKETERGRRRNEEK